MLGVHGGNLKEIAEEYQIPVEAIVDFSANINPLGCSENFLTILEKQLTDVLHYPDLRYTELKAQLAEYHNIELGKIYLGNGAADVLYSFVDVLKVKKVLLLAPTFSEYESAFKQQGTEIIYFRTEKNKFQVNTEELMKMIDSENVDAVCLCNPNNPTGSLIGKDKMKQINSYCQRRNCVLLVDEAFMDFIPKNESIVSELGDSKNLFVLRSLTKIFAIPGLRLGYLLTSNDTVLSELERKAVPWRINCFADSAGRESLKDKKYLEKTIEYIEKERLFLETNLTFFKDLEVFPSQSNFIFFKYKKKENLQKILLELNILIRDCSNYEGLTGDYYRIAVRTREENTRLISALKEICHE